MKILIKNANVFSKDLKFKIRDIFINDLFIEDVGENLNYEVNKIINAKNLLVSPGFIDLHSHLREPGFEYKETIRTGTSAAVAGGFTTVCCMSNLNPVPDCSKNLDIVLKLVKDNALCNVLPFMSMTKKQTGKEICEFDSRCVGLSEDGNSVQSSLVMEKIFKSFPGLLFSVHCENKNEIKKNSFIHDGKYAKQHGLSGISSKVEYSMLKRDLKLAKKFNSHYHMCHVSCKESVKVIRDARNAGVKVTCEVTPHHLCFCEDDLKNNGDFKMNPPLRTKKDQEALIEALNDGTIDCVATDHAPHSEEEKSGGLQDSLMGVIGLETAFSGLYTKLVLTKKILLSRLLEAFTFSPQRIIAKSYKNFGIAKGNRADVTLIDLSKKWKVFPEHFFSKGRATPFRNMKLVSKVVMTIVNGRIVYKLKGALD
ncbi:MAG: dihydroorotase [Oscillospiraceae bacterium]|nr:dihydroorotase [Oscillospiraceae bacterium]